MVLSRETTVAKTMAANIAGTDATILLEREAALCLRLFGAGEIVVRGTPVPRPKNRKDFLLLALLALRQGQTLERDWLAGVLWPDSEASQALYNLRRSLSAIRNALGEEAGRLVSPTSRTLRFDAEDAHIDALLFDKLALRRERDALLQAVSLYRGPLLEGFDAPWALPERNAREQTYLEARQVLAELARDEKDWNEAAKHLRAVIEIDALRESAHRGLMQALAAGGDVAAAVQAYRALRLHLHQELNMSPAAETIALYQRILSESRQAASAPPAYAIVAERAPAGIPPTAFEMLEAEAVGFLPQPLTRLIGREQEAEEVGEHLRHALLVTLTGTGGVGKTRLALRVAEANSVAYPHGVWFVDLSSLSRAEQVVPAIASVLNIQAVPGKALETTLSEWLHPRHARL